MNTQTQSSSSSQGSQGSEKSPTSPSSFSSSSSLFVTDNIPFSIINEETEVETTEETGSYNMLKKFISLSSSIEKSNEDGCILNENHKLLADENGLCGDDTKTENATSADENANGGEEGDDDTISDGQCKGSDIDKG